jgi:hypothetical protein
MNARARSFPSPSKLSAVLAVLALLSIPPALSGCSGSGNGDGGKGPCSRLVPSAQGPGDTEHFFPVAVANRWIYEEAGTTGSTTMEVKITGERMVDGLLASVVTSAPLDGSAAPEEELLRNGPNGVSLHASATEPFPIQGVVPFIQLRWPLTPGDAYVPVSCTGLSLGQDLDDDGRPERLDLRVEVTVGGDEAVTVPAGSFTGRKVTTRTTVTIRATSGLSATLVADEQDWYAPGVGPVRTVRDETASGDSGGPLPEHSEGALVGYNVGGARGGLQRRAPLAADLDTTYSPPAAARLGDRLLLLGVVPDTPALSRLSGRILDASGAITANVDVGSWHYVGARPGMAASDSAWLVVTELCPSACGELGSIRIAPDGALLDPLPGVRFAGGGPAPAAVASDGSGWLAAWYNYPAGIYAARIGADGALLGTITLSEAPGGFPAVAYADGVYLVAFGDARDSGTSISAIRVAPDGTVLDPVPIPISSPPGAKWLGGVASDGERFFVVWGDTRRGDTSPMGYPAVDVYAARVTTGGELLDGPPSGGGIAVNALPGQNKVDPVVAFDGERFVVTWWIDGYWAPAGAYAARVTTDGALVDGPAHGTGLSVAVPSAALRARYPVATPAADGETLLLWAREGAGIEGAWYSW